MNRGHKMRLKRNRTESLGCHDRHPLPRVCLREPGSRDVINWQWRYVIRAHMICYRNNRYLHDVPECLLVKNCPTPSGLPIPVTNKIQNAIQYKDRSPDWWCLAHMTSARARGRSNRLFTAAICMWSVGVTKGQSPGYVTTYFSCFMGRECRRYHSRERRRTPILYISLCAYSPVNTIMRQTPTITHNTIIDIGMVHQGKFVETNSDYSGCICRWNAYFNVCSVSILRGQLP